MSPTIALSASDVADAANFLESFLGEEVPDGDFTKGTALRDLTIGAIAAIFAYLTQQNTLVRARQSLATMQQGVVDADPASLQDAVTALLSNFFITPNQGLYARGTALGHSTTQTDIFITPSQRFTYAPGLDFTVDNGGAVFVIAAATLLPIFDTSGAVTEYQFNIPLKALAIGEQFNVSPGLFSSFDRFSPYVSSVEVTAKFAGGKSAETLAEVTARAPTAVSVRNLINDRSIRAVLGDNFPDIKAITVIGMGDPEMQRDVLTGVAAHLAVHVGGAVDIYLLLDLVETSFTGVIGGQFERPDGLVTIFTDIAGAIFGAVEVGDIIRITAGIPNVPREFFVDTKVSDSKLLVSERIPFPVATDELIATNATYSIGRVSPSFNDVIATLTTGITSRSPSTSGRITLPGGPVMDILDVAILNPPVAMAAYQSPLDGYIHFTDRVNTAPAANTDVTVPLQYRVVVWNPGVAQSAQQYMEIDVGQPFAMTLGSLDSYNLKVRYLTLSNYGNINTFVTGRAERTVAANQITRGHYPIKLSFTIDYKLKVNAPSLLDDNLLAQSLVDFVNSFDTTTEPLSTSAIIQYLTDQNPSIATVFPFNIYYALFAADGSLVQFTTTDEVLLSDMKKVDGQPVLDYTPYSIRTVRYLTDAASIVTIRQ